MTANREVQIAIPFDSPKEWNDSSNIAVLDLFSGIGGIALGFKAAKFLVTGVDVEPLSAAVFDLNNVGAHIQRDLRDKSVIRDVKVVVGGPPCRPWSAVNLQRRGTRHKDYAFIERFFSHVADIRPHVFLMENVPAVGGDAGFIDRLGVMGDQYNYSVERQRVKYSDFGVATTRTRLFTVGIHRSSSWSGADFFAALSQHHRKRPKTVRDAIGWLEHVSRGDWSDHEWSQLQSIQNYTKRYETGQYGWKQLEWDRPAPSFGSVSKTYILHPNAGKGDYPLRVLSVREVLSIMGFKKTFRFPRNASLSKRYVMAANAVSPVVATACATVIRGILSGAPSPGGSMGRTFETRVAEMKGPS